MTIQMVTCQHWIILKLLALKFKQIEVCSQLDANIYNGKPETLSLYSISQDNKLTAITVLTVTDLIK